MLQRVTVWVECRGLPRDLRVAARQAQTPQFCASLASRAEQRSAEWSRVESSEQPTGRVRFSCPILSCPVLSCSSPRAQKRPASVSSLAYCRSILSTLAGFKSTAVAPARPCLNRAHRSFPRPHLPLLPVPHLVRLTPILHAPSHNNIHLSLQRLPRPRCLRPSVTPLSTLLPPRSHTLLHNGFTSFSHHNLSSARRAT